MILPTRNSDEHSFCIFSVGLVRNATRQNILRIETALRFRTDKNEFGRRRDNRLPRSADRHVHRYKGWRRSTARLTQNSKTRVVCYLFYVISRYDENGSLSARCYLVVREYTRHRSTLSLVRIVKISYYYYRRYYVQSSGLGGFACDDDDDETFSVLREHQRNAQLLPRTTVKNITLLLLLYL